MNNKHFQVSKATGATLNIVHKGTDGNAINITGYIFNLYAQKNDTDDDAVLMDTATVHDNAAAGQTHFVISTADIADFNGIYNLYITVQENVSAVARPSENGAMEVV